MDQEAKVLAEKAGQAFRLYEDLLSKCRSGSPLKGRARTAAVREYEAARAALQPHGEWAIGQVRAALEQIRVALLLPPGYTTRMTSEGRPFIAGDINTPDDISLYVGNRDIPLDDPNQFGIEVRMRLDSPRLIVFFTVGEQHSFKGRRIDIFPDGPRLKCETYRELAERTIAALSSAIVAAGFKPF